MLGALLIGGGASDLYTDCTHGGKNMFVRKFPRRALILLINAALLVAGCNFGATPAPTIDVNALGTAIAGTAVAQLSNQLTLTALAAPTSTPEPPTDTPVPLPSFALSTPTGSGGVPTISFNATAIASPLPGFTQLASSPVAQQPTAALNDPCNSLAFEGDATIPDGTILKPGVNFKKAWAVRNTGTCKWDEGYTLVYIGGTTPNLDPYDFKFKSSSDFVAPGQAINLTITLTTPCIPGKYNGTWRMRNDQGFYFGTPLSVYVEVQEKCK